MPANRGFFMGVSLDGAVLSMDRKANGEYYQGETSPAKILTDTSIPSPATGRRFVDTLAAMAPALQHQSGARAAALDPEMAAPPPAGARTYGINETGTAPPAPEGPF
jgi:hypothetical protein